MIYIDKNVKNTKRVFPMQNRYGFHRYDMNENPEGLPKKFVKSVLKNITPEFLATYPEPDKFIEKYSKFVGVDKDMIIPTNGSDRAIRTILETFGDKKKEVLMVSPTFEMYWVNCKILGLKFRQINFNSDFTLDVSLILKSINKNTGIIVLLNPNSPIGYTYSDEDIKAIITKAKQYNCLVIIDEAYYYFYDKTFLNESKRNKNVLVIRTFSKMFSLAAVRLGVIIGNPYLIKMLNNSRLSFDVNSIALLFGEKIIDNPKIYNKLIITQQEGKDFLIEELKKHSYECLDCKGNYVLLKTHGNAREVEQELKERFKVLVHGYSNELLKDYLRVTTGSIKSMKFFIKCLLSVDSNVDSKLIRG